MYNPFVQGLSLPISYHTLKKCDNNSKQERNRLLILLGANDQETDKTGKNIIQIFKYIGFKIDIRPNLKETRFLDVTFNLTNGTIRPYKKSHIQCSKEELL